MRFILILTALLLSSTAFAGGGNGDCDHPRFQEVGCSYPGEQGPPGQDGEDGQDGQDGRDGVDGQDGRDGIDGQDGRDGADGRDGVDGKDGRDGRDGVDGRDGIDGVVPTEWINETRNNFYQYGRFASAMQATDVFLPQEQDFRITGNFSRVHGNTGYGFGLGYIIPDNERRTGFTLAIGRSGSETVGKASIGFEFGGDD